jgi:adenine-specific DNA-methyltransferase
MSDQMIFESLIEDNPLLLKEGSTRTRYLGSKARIATEILEIIGVPQDGAFVDVFSGTGIVSRQAALRGWKIIANDHLLSSSITTTAHLLAKEDVPFHYFGGYCAALDNLLQAKPEAGFIFHEYTPGGKNNAEQERMYFTSENGQKIDGVRKCIEEWHIAGMITAIEKTLLTADLLSATNSIANIAGTYGCFLSYWNSNALRPLTLIPRTLLPKRCEFFVLSKDAFEVPTSPKDVAYLDPPYTKRQYAAYYHILETIAAGDTPEVGGITGLRPWREKSSPFCYKTKAHSALERLITTLHAQRIVLSYSSEGHMALESIEAIFRRYGIVSVHNIDDIGRYRPNQEASAAGTNVTEYLVELIKNPCGMEAM